MKIYCHTCNKYRNSTNPENHIFLKNRSFNCLEQCGHEYKKIFKDEKSIKILKILGLVTNIEEGEYQEIYNDV